MRRYIQFLYRGEIVTVDSVKPTDMVLTWLRETRLATGTKEGCNEGDCGACTVVLGRLDPNSGDITYTAVNACILMMAQIDGAWLITVEELALQEAGGPSSSLHPIQASMIANNATQCGFCTPGFVMVTLAGQLSNSPLSPQAQLAGNLCRCTGYGGLLATARDALDQGKPPAWRAREAQVIPMLQSLTPGGFCLTSDGRRIDAPENLSVLLSLCHQYPDALLVAGATDVGLWMTKRLDDPPHVIMTRYVRELQAVEMDDDMIRIGAGVSYSDAAGVLLADYPEAQEWFERLGSVQVRDAGTLGGNIANGSPIGDSPPLLIALGARLEIAHADGALDMALEDFFIAYGKQNLGAGEVVVAVKIPRRSPGQRLAARKISKRYDQDISSVMAVFSVRDGVHRYAFGGMAGVPALATKAMESRDPEDLDQDFSPMSDHRASADYRRQVSKNLLGAFLAEGKTL